MNQAGRDALRAAGLAGVKQITGRMADGQGGLCAMGVLAKERDAMPWSVAHSIAIEKAFDLDIHRLVWCPMCPSIRSEYGLVSHLNDQHGCDFLKIAELMPVTDQS